MLIRCWGSRGSIPVSGKEYLKYGGDTTCMEIQTEDDRTIIVDAGTGIRRLGKRLIEEDRRSCDLIFTHAHWDHLMGFPFFRPLYSEGSEIRVHGCPVALDFVHTMLTRIMSPPNFPVSYADVRASIQYTTVCPEKFEIGNVSVFPVPLSHPNGGNGYKFTEKGRSFVFLTDNELEFIHPGGLSAAQYRDFCKGVDLLFHDAEYTEDESRRYRRWGHSAYTSALELALESEAGQLGLYHLNQDREDAEMDRIVEHCRETVKRRKSPLTCFAVACDTEIKLS